MAEIDELLEQAEAQDGINSWVLVTKYQQKEFYSNSDRAVNVIGRRIETIKEDISVQGENHSQYVEFIMDRYYDGIDIAEQTLAIHYEVGDVSDEDAPVNVYKNDTQIKFGWVVENNLTQYATTIEFCIWARGTLADGNAYILKTLPQKYEIQRGLTIAGGIIEPSNNWYTQFALTMDEKVAQANASADRAEQAASSVDGVVETVTTARDEVVNEASVVDTQHSEVESWHQEAEQFRNEAKQFRDEAEQFAPSGYSELVKVVSKNTESITNVSGKVEVLEQQAEETANTIETLGNELGKTTLKVDTIIEKAELGIKETASGEQIHLDDSADSVIKEFALFGKATQNTTSGKNLISYPYSSDSASDRNGIAWTNNDDGTIFVNGTATANSFHNLTNATTPVEENWLVLRKGTYTISDGVTNNNDVAVFLQLDSTSGPTYTDTTFTIEEDAYYKIYARVLNGKTVNNVTLKPMLRLASIEDDTYEPYTGGIPSPNPEYPQEIEVSGESYNLIPYPYYETTKESNGVLFTLNENDGSIVVNGTATANGSFIFNHRIDNTMILGAGEYKVSGCPSGGSNTTYRLIVGKTSSAGSFEVVTKDLGSGAIFTLTEDTDVYVAFEVLNGTTVNNLVVRPMIRKASVKNDRYMPYGKGSVEVKSVGKNLLNIDTRTQTADGVTLTVNEIDKSIIANGTATKDVNFVISRYSGDASQLNGKFFSGSVGGSSATYFLRISDTVNSASDNLDGTSKISTLTNTGIIRVSLFVKAGVKLDNVKFYPMISDDGGEYQPYKETISTIPTPNGLAGIKVSSGGNYTDSNGQQWICDEIVKYADGSGEYVQRVISEVFDGITNKVNAVNISTEYGVSFSSSAKNNTLMNKLVVKSGNSYDLLCSHFVTKFALYNPSTTKDYGCGIYRTSANIWFSIDKNTASKIGINVDTATVEQFNLWLQENPVIVYGILAEPIRTPLTAEQLAEIEKLCTFSPITNISNDADCGMKVKYLVDSKNYVDKKLELQAKAREEEMMAMFLLLPDEVQAAMIENDTNNLMSGMEE